jgi:flagellar biosynthesis/type III secretory pathway chaperone
MSEDSRMGAAQRPGQVAKSAVAALTDVLRSERRLLQELLGVMQRQREAIAADDLQAIEESVYSTHRVLHTLNEARRRRRSINRLLGESDDLSIRNLDSVLSPQMPADLRRVRDELEVLAEALSTEVDLNRTALRGALAAAPGDCPKH